MGLINALGISILTSRLVSTDGVKSSVARQCRCSRRALAGSDARTGGGRGGEAKRIKSGGSHVHRPTGRGALPSLVAQGATGELIGNRRRANTADTAQQWR